MIGHFQSRIFGWAFLISLLFYFVFTVFIFDYKTAGVGAGNAIHGFPFGYDYSTCFGGDYLWSGLASNALAGAVMSGLIALACSYFWTKFSDPNFRAKWYL
jgi:hypothetical protein